MRIVLEISAPVRITFENPGKKALEFFNYSECDVFLEYFSADTDDFPVRILGSFKEKEAKQP